MCSSAIILNPVKKSHRLFAEGTRAMPSSVFAYRNTSSLQYSITEKCSADESENRLIVSNCMQTSFYTVRLKHPTVGRRRKTEFGEMNASIRFLLFQRQLLYMSKRFQTYLQLDVQMEICATMFSENETLTETPTETYAY